MRLSPADFWNLTVAEWRWLAQPEGDAMTRAEFERLAALYPDAGVESAPGN
ncbi:MAG: phage tail assembly chaperone [Alphaproteobacteria bacterium]|nr:phage tail assembly chaperone [Alphaproteobacteria bacterium]